MLVNIGCMKKNEPIHEFLITLYAPIPLPDPLLSRNSAGAQWGAIFQ